MKTKLTCACGKHETKLKELMKEQEPFFRLTKELLRQQAKEIFEEIDKKTLHSVEEMERAMGDCNTDIAYHNGMLVIRKEIRHIKKKWVK